MLDVLFIDLLGDFDHTLSTWSLGFRYMMSSLRRNGFSAALLHAPAHHARRGLIDEIVRTEALIVGFTTYDVQLAALLEFIKDLREAGLRSHITLGGLCAAAIPGLLLEKIKEVDSVVVGEGEQAIVDLARKVILSEGNDAIPGIWMRTPNGVARGEPRPLLKDLDMLPTPALDNVGNGRNGCSDYKSNGCIPVLASRGCYGRCTFCCIQRFYRSCPGALWRGRRPAAVIDEISTVTKLSGARKVTFVDENFMGPGATGRDHAVQIANELVRKGLKIRFNFGCRPNDVDRETIALLKISGLAGVTLGIESMGSEALALFNKRTTPLVNYHALRLLEELEVPTEITFIFFHPLTTLDEVEANLDFIDYVRQSRFAYFNNDQPFSQFVPFFGTELTQQLSEMKLATRTLTEYSIQYEDPRVALIAEQVLSMPVSYIPKLERHLAKRTSKTSRAIRAKLYSYYSYLNMVRLPNLASDLCRLLKHGESPKGPTVRGVLDAFAYEQQMISSLVGAFTTVASRVY